MSKNSSLDYTVEAAHHVRDTWTENGREMGSSHAHAIVAACLGYDSRVAMLATGSKIDPHSQWLHREPADLVRLTQAIQRMNGQGYLLDHVYDLANHVLDGLAPPCCETGLRSRRNIPIGDVAHGDETDWVHPGVCEGDDASYALCPLCGDDRAYPLSQLDGHGLCPEHAGEFDWSPEEEQGWRDLAENLAD